MLKGAVIGPKKRVITLRKVCIILVHMNVVRRIELADHTVMSIIRAKIQLILMRIADYTNDRTDHDLLNYLAIDLKLVTRMYIN